MSDENEQAETLVKRIGAALMSDWVPITVSDLAARLGVREDASFKRDLWRAFEAHRTEHGQQLRIRDGRVVRLTDVELAKLSRSNIKTAARKERRAIARAMTVRLAELPEGERAGHVAFTERRIKMLAVRALASHYQDPIAGLAKAMATNAGAALNERAMRQDSIRLLAEKAAK